jgi:tetratricopeptide (TPR) repeat protein
MTKKQSTQAFQGDEAHIQELLDSRRTLAEALHGFTSRAQAEGALAAVFATDEATQMELLRRLVRERDADAADVLLAMHELAPAKIVRKEARRALIQLAGAKVYPSWTPAPEEPAVGSLTAEKAPRFWKGSIAQSRESGELQLILCWEQGLDYGQARMISFLLDFWAEGVKDFFTETGAKRHIDEHIDQLQEMVHAARAEYGEEDSTDSIKFVACTLAEGRRVLNEALAVNRWRKKEPHKDFRQHLGLVQRLILHATEMGEDRGLSFIAPGQEPDMLAANFAGAWSMGDYGLCYDLLTRTSSLLEGHERDAWTEMRRKWADEAHVARFEMYFLHEYEQNQQSTLWLPTSVRSQRANEQKEIELGWSLELSDTPLSGTLPEMPMGTAVYKETGRHWFWTIFTLKRENGEWRVASIKDEGAAIQALPVEELRRRMKEHNEVIQKLVQEHEPTEPHSQENYDEIIKRSWKILALDDALLVKMPLDKTIYEDAYGRAMSVGTVERAVVYAEGLVKRFPSDPDHLTATQRLGAIQIAVAERFAQLRLKERAEYFEKLGEVTLRSVLNESDPMGHLLLAEFFLSRAKLEEAEEALLKARELAQENDVKAQIEFDLADLEIERKEFAKAQRHLEKVAEFAPNHPLLWTTLGMVHRNQENYPEAEIYYKRALEEHPADVRAYADLAAIYLMQREFDKAHYVLSQGIRVLPQSAHLRALMATVYLEQNDIRRAQEYLQDAERINPHLEIVHAVRELLKTK